MAMPNKDTHTIASTPKKMLEKKYKSPEEEYIKSPSHISLKDLAEKWNKPFATIAYRSRIHNWVKKRTLFQAQVGLGTSPETINPNEIDETVSIDKNVRRVCQLGLARVVKMLEAGHLVQPRDVASLLTAHQRMEERGDEESVPRLTLILRPLGPETRADEDMQEASTEAVCTTGGRNDAN